MLRHGWVHALFLVARHMPLLVESIQSVAVRNVCAPSWNNVDPPGGSFHARVEAPCHLCSFKVVFPFAKNMGIVLHIYAMTSALEYFEITSYLWE